MEGGLTSSTLPFLISLALILLIKAIFFKAKHPKPHLPPGPRPIPIVGHLHLLRPPLHQSFHKLTSRHGPLIHLLLGSTPAVVASSPDTVRELLKTHDLAFANRPQYTAVRRFAYDSAGFAFAPYGPYWKFMKRLCMSELLGGRTVDQLSPVRRTELHALLRTLLHKARSSNPVDISWELIKMTNNVITRMTASSTTSDTEEARKLVKQVAELVGVFNLSDYIGIFRNLDLQGLNKRINVVHERFDAFMERIIKEKEEIRKRRKERGEGDNGVKDLLDIMLDVSEDENADMKLTRENIKGFALDIFTAGSDSSAATVEWALAELINHPCILRKLREEIDKAVGKDRLVRESDIPNLPYLYAVVKETLRLHPAAPLAIRVSDKEVKVGGYEIPANTSLFVNVWSIGRDPNCWKDPLEFRPERFAAPREDGLSSIDFRGQHFELLPFGSGRRVCPGISLALQVIQLTLAALVHCFEWKVDGKEEERSGGLDMSEGIGMVILRAQPLVCVPVARLDPFPPLDP
ncbi:cytochrome P450 93A3-like [Phoenix dactylifera]|uniref:Cytochrome P450 93A3-like n=1 Tax=Phoenix dactylifera TaxID=42345 RepID=A0A8B8ZZM4_PHODC|nr:cytochrome P450 93A3-like [Phoenix dactylifera]